MVNAAMLAVNVITGISPANNFRMESPKSLALVLASRNLLYSICCEFSTRMMAAPRMLSLITLFSQSITARLCLNNPLTFRSTKKNVTPMMGIMAITQRANFQLIEISRMLAPMMIKTEEIMETMAWEMNILMESVSAVRLVNNLAG